MSLQHQFIEFALDTKVLRFGEFKTKAGYRLTSLISACSIPVQRLHDWVSFMQKRFYKPASAASLNLT